MSDEEGKAKTEEEELISKKEVLALTEISYGQFYRWKRKGLIPEAWFVRKSTFTGQETFLPRAKILERIEKIKALKDDHSLEELAEILSPEVVGRRFSAEEVERMDWISPEVRRFYDEMRPQAGGYTFQEVLIMTVIEELRARRLPDEEVALAASTLLEYRDELQGDFRWSVILVSKAFAPHLTRSRRKPTTSFCFLSDGRCLLDPGRERATVLELHPILEEVKLKLRQIG